MRRPSTTLPVAFPKALRARLTPQEVKLWNWLRESIGPTGFHFRRQVPIERFIVDFACLAARTVIEVDGEQHGSVSGRLRDEARDARLSELDFKVLRFSNREIDREKRVVLDTIHAELVARTNTARSRSTRADPPPSGGGGSREAADGGGRAP